MEEKEKEQWSSLCSAWMSKHLIYHSHVCILQGADVNFAFKIDLDGVYMGVFALWYFIISRGESMKTILQDEIG